MILLTLRDLRHRLVRFVVVVLLGAVVLSLLFVMTGLVEQFHREPVDTVEAFGADDWVLPSGVNGPFTAAPSMPVAAVAEVVAGDVAPVVTARSSIRWGGSSSEIVLAGHEPGALGTPPTTEGRAAEQAGEVVIDETLGIDIGDTVEIAGSPFEVVGLSRDTTLLAGIPLAFTTLADAQDLVFRSRDVASGVLTRGEVGPLPDGLVAHSAADVAADTLKPLDGAIASVDLVRALLWVVAAVIIGAVVYLSALERQRDFAVLKAVGTPNRTLLASLAVQAVLVALAAVGLAMIIQLFLAPAFPLKVRVPARAYWQLPLLAIVIALAAGAAGMRRVSRCDPAQAFAGAGG